jgi:hypothetical protein
MWQCTCQNDVLVSFDFSPNAPGLITFADHCPGPGQGPRPLSVCQPHINLELGVPEAAASAGAAVLAGATADHILIHLQLNLDKVCLQFLEVIKLNSQNFILEN